MNIAFGISAYLFFISLAAKIIIHIYLDNSNGYRIVVSPVSTWTYLLPYDKDVSDEFGRKKELCNKIQKLSIYFLCSTILLVIMRAFLTHN